MNAILGNITSYFSHRIEQQSKQFASFQSTVICWVLIRTEYPQYEVSAKAYYEERRTKLPDKRDGVCSCSSQIKELSDAAGRGKEEFANTAEVGGSGP